MKKAFIGATILAGIAIIAIIAFLGYKAISVTDPYLVKPASIAPAAHDAKPRFSFDPKTRALSVISSKEVVVVSDPGTSFQYEVTWIVEQPRKTSNSSSLEYRYTLPKFARADHINPPDSDIPPNILKVANSNSWN